MVGLLEENPGKDKDVIMNNLKEHIIVDNIMKKIVDNNQSCENVNDIDENAKKIISSSPSSLCVTNSVAEDGNEEQVLEIVKLLLNEMVCLVENDNCDNHLNKEENSGEEETGEEVEENKHKGILKHERTYSNKHVDFDLALKYIPFNPKTDYTVDIQFVETIQKRVVSYAALFAQRKADEEAIREAEEAAAKAAEEAEKVAAKAAAIAAAKAAAIAAAKAAAAKAKEADAVNTNEATSNDVVNAKEVVTNGIDVKTKEPSVKEDVEMKDHLKLVAEVEGTKAATIGTLETPNNLLKVNSQ